MPMPSTKGYGQVRVACCLLFMNYRNEILVSERSLGPPARIFGLLFRKMQKLLLGLFAFLGASAHGLRCIGDTGAAVDYWFAVKGPKGTDYVYYDTQNALARSTHSMNDTSVGALGRTLTQLWSDSVEYLMFNDEPPGQTNYNFTVGHTKGVWAWDVGRKEAIIVQHSIPLFPVGPGRSEKYNGLGKNAWMYGQHASCFSLALDDLVRSAEPVRLTIPSVYDSRISSATPVELAELANGSWNGAPHCESMNFVSTGGLNVTLFAKSSAWNNELYAACVAPALDASLSVESWLRGSEEGPACGGAQTVVDVQAVSYPGGLDFTEYNDHSKWAVDVAGDWFCAADINRMTTQYARGGAAYCFQDHGLAYAMRTAITKEESCARGLKDRNSS
jgi:hypothetical protein